MESQHAEGTAGSDPRRLERYSLPAAETSVEELGHRSRYGGIYPIPRLADDSPRFKQTLYVHKGSGFHGLWLHDAPESFSRIERAIHAWRIEWLMKQVEERLQEEE